jgi:hypothetical protein
VPSLADAVIDLGGIVLPDARTRTAVDLGGLTGVCVLTLIRHRF